MVNNRIECKNHSLNVWFEFVVHSSDNPVTVHLSNISKFCWFRSDDTLIKLSEIKIHRIHFLMEVFINYYSVFPIVKVGEMLLCE
jgi:hypothetical protein